MNRRVIIALFSVLALASCIKNDLPKPVVDLYIASIDVEGVEGDIVIDRSTYTVTIPLAEESNIDAVKIKSITYDADVVTNVNYEADASKIIASKELNGATIVLSKPEYITLSYFQTYEWKIVATQTIRRVWRVDYQIGTTEWDVEGCRAIVKRRNDQPLANVKTTEVRFGPDTYDYPAAVEMPTNFDNATFSQEISVWRPWDAAPTIWKLVVVPTEPSLTFVNVAAGANVIWIKAVDIEGSEVVFAYRKKGESEWIKVKKEWVATDASNPYNRFEQGYIKAVIRGLEPDTEYEVSGYTDDKLSEEEPKVVKTSRGYQMPNSDMEGWCKEGACWYPASSVLDFFWGTGNPGGTSLGEAYNLTTPAYKSVNPLNVPADSTGEVSAYMGSQNVLNMKFAAGNLFVGHYGETLGTNATVYFGRPLSQDVKPVAFRFKVKYYRGNIDCVGDSDLESKRGTQDLAKVFVSMTEWKAPHCVNSKDKTTFFDPRTAAGTLGVGYFDSDNNPELVAAHTDEWHTMTIPIEYTKPEGVATHIVLTFTCSGYGDYFTGSSNSWMFVDDVELLYDLDENNQPK